MFKSDFLKFNEFQNAHAGLKQLKLNTLNLQIGNNLEHGRKRQNEHQQSNKLSTRYPKSAMKIEFVQSLMFNLIRQDDRKIFELLEM